MHTIKKNVAMPLFITAALSLPILKSHSQTPTLVYTPVITSGLSASLDVINAGDGTNRLFIVERTGRVKIVSNGVLQPGNFINVQDSLPPGDENGLLTVAFHPDYETNGYVFIYYLNEDYDVRITRFQAANPLTNNPINQNTGKVLLTIPENNSLHNGGKMLFGPDGMLYFGTGDGSPGGDPNNQAQNGNLLVGKMIRLDVSSNFNTAPYYTIPPDNPYVNNPAVRDEIFAIGMRNPWRWSFDRLNNDVWIADVGEGAWEEINRVPFASSGGINYGWRCYEGTHDYITAGCMPQSNYTFPIFEYPHNSGTGGFSVTGGHVYRGAEYGALYGYYICSDFISKNAWLIKPNGSGGWITSIQPNIPAQIVGYGENELGHLYAISLSGTLYKVTTNTGGPLPVTILQLTAKAFTGYNELRWKTTNEQNVLNYDIEFSVDGTNYTSAGKVNAFNNPSENNYLFKHNITLFTKIFYKLKITDKDGRISYSGIIPLEKKDWASIRVFPTLVTDNRLNIVSDQPLQQVVLYSAEGRNVYQSAFNNVSGTINILLPNLQKGIYILRIKRRDELVTREIMIQ